MISVGLTGNVASGKSTVASAWASEGVPVVSADDLARRAVAPGSEGLEAVRREFGGEVLSADGTLDRSTMRDLVFRDPEARRRLESIVHPVVRELRLAWLAERREEGARIAVSEIPLLFESGMERDVDVVVLVDAPEPVRIRRLVDARGLDEAEARRMVDAQTPASRKRHRSDHVLDNEDTVESLEAAARVLLGRILDPALVRMDLHMHTWGSRDCLTDPEALLRRALDRGMRRIAITDHDRLGVALEMSVRHPDRIIVGEEVRTEEGVDLIGHYLTEEIPRGTPAAEVAERVREQGGVVYLPHPYAPGKGGGGRFAEELAAVSDVVEVFNARLHPAASRNDPAEALAVRHGSLRGAGSDAHTVGEVANAWVEVAEHPNEASAFARALRRARVHGEEAPRWVHLASTWAKVRKRLPGAPGTP